MIPGEVFPAKGDLTLNQGSVANSAPSFDREAACGCRLDIAAGTAVRFEPGHRRVYDFNQVVMEDLD